MRIVDLHEREKRIFPRADLLDAHGQSRLLAATRALSAVELKDIASGVELRALGLIGVLPLTTSITLNIRPKFSLQNLWLMLELADENYEQLLPVIRSYEPAVVGAPQQLLARSFCHYLEKIWQLGVARGYETFEYRGHYRPKTNIGKTLSAFTARGDDIRSVADAVSFSAQLRVNGVLKSACYAFIRIIPASPQWSRERTLVRDMLNALRSVQQLQMRPGDIRLSGEVPSWSRLAYGGALSAYSVLLGHTKIGFGYSSQGTDLPSFLFSLDTIFESFIRNTLRRDLERYSVAVVDGNVSRHQIPLFSDNRKFIVKPDLIFKRERRVIALGEVKYKPKVEDSDRYQLISHVSAHSAPIGIWISPSTDQESGLTYVGKIAGAKFYHYKFNLAGHLLPEQEKMVAAVVGLLELA